MRKVRSAISFITPKGFARRHVFSDFNGPWENFTDDERRIFIKTIFACSDFVGIQVVALSIFPRGFDILLDVPAKLALDRVEMLSRLLAYRDKANTISESPPFEQAGIPPCPSSPLSRWLGFRR